jgi:natural product precursor
MKKNLKKLRLSRETLRNLDQPQLRHVAGGATASATEPISHCTNDCCGRTDFCTETCTETCTEFC